MSNDQGTHTRNLKKKHKDRIILQTAPTIGIGIEVETTAKMVSYIQSITGINWERMQYGLTQK